MHGDFYHAFFISSVFFFLQNIAPLLLNGNKTVQGETQLAGASLLLLLSPKAQGHVSTRQTPRARKKQNQSSEVCN